ncbi:hypothetical protein [Rubrivirga sp.]|uniref:hypothetical protein n=1 Tax=Rubrivirga sp. TaxID=1885344 RepID=UPI003C76CCF5
MRSVLTTLFLGATLSACSLFGPEVERLDATTVLQGEASVTADTVSLASNSPFLTSLEDEALFRARYGISEPFGADYAASTLVAVAEPVTSRGGQLVIDAVELIGDDRARVTYRATGTPGEAGARLLVHVVRVPRIDLTMRQIETEYSTPSR